MWNRSKFHNEVSYPEWCETLGEYRWFKKDGSPRTFYTLEYGYPEIYKLVTSNADLRFNERIIFNIEEFTSLFLAAVPLAWLKFKAQLEFLNGTYDGKTLEPDIFEQGFTRTISQIDARNTTGKAGSITDMLSDNTLGARLDTTKTTDSGTSGSKGRQILYNQGVQALEPNNANIGELGRDYASGLQDSVNNGTTSNNNDTTLNQGAQNNNSSSSIDNRNAFENNDMRGSDTRIHETRINMYDNIAFLKLRMEFVESIKSFEDYFQSLFGDISSMNRWYNYANCIY